MRLQTTFIATAVLALGGLSATADTLILNNGREMRGKLVSVSRGIVLFAEEGGRRTRVNLNRVDQINIGDDALDDQRDDNTYTSDRNNNNNNRNNNRNNDRDNDRDNDRNSEQSFAVYADRVWTDTGMTVRAGDILRFHPSGEIVWGPGRRDGAAGEVNSPHNHARPIHDKPGAALIGRIGNETFHIGDGSSSFTTRTSGRLFLGINDDHVQDNQGHFQVVVQRHNQ